MLGYFKISYLIYHTHGCKQLTTTNNRQLCFLVPLVVIMVHIYVNISPLSSLDNYCKANVAGNNPL